MNEKRIGIITSLAIHAVILSLFLTISVASVNPSTKIFYISFAQDNISSPLSHNEKKTIIRSEANTMRTTSKTEVTEIQRPHDEFAMNEKPVAVAVQKAEHTQSANTEVESTGKAENMAVMETSFGNTGAPVFVHREMPEYPFTARRFGKEGKVVLKLLIDMHGKLQNIEVIEPSGFGFTEAAVTAIKKSSFSPAYRNGEKIASKALLSVRFILR